MVKLQFKCSGKQHNGCRGREIGSFQSPTKSKYNYATMGKEALGV